MAEISCGYTSSTTSTTSSRTKIVMTEMRWESDRCWLVHVFQVVVLALRLQRHGDHLSVLAEGRVDDVVPSFVFEQPRDHPHNVLAEGKASALGTWAVGDEGGVAVDARILLPHLLLQLELGAVDRGDLIVSDHRKSCKDKSDIVLGICAEQLLSYVESECLDLFRKRLREEPRRVARVVSQAALDVLDKVAAVDVGVLLHVVNDLVRNHSDDAAVIFIIQREKNLKKRVVGRNEPMKKRVVLPPAGRG